jgi:uncharacterized membrane protein
MSESHDDARTGRVEAHRLDGFFDAAFAFAVSLLAIAGAEIPHSLHDLLLALNRIPAFACSFATMLMFWHRHVRWRDRFRTHDTFSVLVSLMLVFFALIFVYPLNMLFSAMFNGIYGMFTGNELPDALVINTAPELTALYVCYGIAYACMAGCVALLYRHSIRRQRVSHVENVQAREIYYVQLGSIAVALLSIVMALLLPQRGGVWTAVPGCTYALLSLVYSITGRWSRRALAKSP